MKQFVGITGTTCVGKSQVAVHLAKMLNTQIVSADSMQVYAGMDIGTAKISTEEMQGITHYMLDVTLPNCDFSSFEYRQMAAPILENMNSLPIVVGGTGFYFDSLIYPPEFGTVNKSRRIELQKILQEDGLGALCEILRKIDLQSYNTIDLQNPVRVIRAIEIAECGGSRAAGNGKSKPQFDARIFVLQCNRQELYANIDSRVDKMLELGLVDEVKNLVEKYGVCNTSAFSAIGYKEIIAYLRGEIDFENAKMQIKLNTRHYAKRQITYFKKLNVFQFVDVDNKAPKEVAQMIFEKSNW